MNYLNDDFDFMLSPEWDQVPNEEKQAFINKLMVARQGKREKQVEDSENISAGMLFLALMICLVKAAWDYAKPVVEWFIK